MHELWLVKSRLSFTGDGAGGQLCSRLLRPDLVDCVQLRMTCVQGWTKKVVSKDDWEKKLAAVKVYKEDMNKLVMDFLVTEVVSHNKAQCNECFATSDLGTIHLGTQT